MWIDTHCHLSDPAFDQDRDEVIAAAIEAGVSTMILACSNLEDGKKILNIIQDQPNLYGCLGFHPHDAKAMKAGDIAEIKRLVEKANSQDKKIVAIGEIGLDYYYEHSERKLQKQVFWEQIQLAHSLDLPLVIHEREASQDNLDILQKAHKVGLLRARPGVVHCYSGSLEMARELIKLGFFLGFDGPITFKNAKRPVENVQALELDHLLVETDSPYLTPVPYRGRRNEPKHVILVGERMAEIKGLDPATVASATSRNASLLFGL